MLALVALLASGGLALLVIPGPVGESAAIGDVPGGPDAPFYFEPNLGQADASASFIGRGKSELHRFLPTAVQTTVFATDGDEPRRVEGAVVPKMREPQRLRTASVLMQFLDANPAHEAIGVGETEHRSAYFVGHGGEKAIRDVPSYVQVHYRRLWPGIDAVFRAPEGRLEYDFHLAPGADPRRIALGFDGAVPRIGQAGELVLATPIGELVHQPPVTFQDSNGERIPVASAYEVRPDGRVGFRLGEHDRRLPLVIDPVMTVRGSYLGGSGNDVGYGIAVDDHNNVYTVGYTLSTNFPTTVGANDTTANGATDAFVTKWRDGATGLVKVFSTYLGGSGDDLAYAVALDASANVAVVGTTDSDDFPAQGAFTNGNGGSSRHGGRDAFVTLLAANGTALVHSAYLGGSANDAAHAVTVDSNGRIVVAGNTSSSDFPKVREYGAFQGVSDAFAARLTATGALLDFSTPIGGTGQDEAFGVAVDDRDAVLIAGRAQDGFPTKNAHQSAYGGSGDGFAARFMPFNDQDALKLEFSTYLGGSADEIAEGISVDPQGNPTVTGSTNSTNFPTTTGAYATTRCAGSDIFLTKVRPDGRALNYSTYIGGKNDDYGYAVATVQLQPGQPDPGYDPDTGDLTDGTTPTFVSGLSFSKDLTCTSTLTPSANVTAIRFLTNATGPQYLLNYGGSGDDGGYGVAIDRANGAWITGFTPSTDFSDMSGTNGGNTDAFVYRVCSDVDGGEVIANTSRLGEFGLYYSVVIPSCYNHTARPLLMGLHGCFDDAASMSDHFNLTAFKEQFIGVYPQAPNHTIIIPPALDTTRIGCWNGGIRWQQQRTGTMPSLLRNIVTSVVNDYQATHDLHINESQMFVGGFSAGALMSSVLTATYPEVFQGQFMHSGLHYKRFECKEDAAIHGCPLPRHLYEPAPATNDTARAAYAAGGLHGAGIRTLVAMGSLDYVVGPENALLATNHSLALYDLFDNGRGDGSTDRVHDDWDDFDLPIPNYDYEVFCYDDGGGNRVAEMWMIYGLGHRWSGGAALGTPDGPDMAPRIWRFLTNGGNACDLG